MRRSEIDRLTWKHFNWQRGTISIEATEYGMTKTEGSAEEIDIGTDLLIQKRVEHMKRLKAELAKS